MLRERCLCNILHSTKRLENTTPPEIPTSSHFLGVTIAYFREGLRRICILDTQRRVAGSPQSIEDAEDVEAESKTISSSEVDCGRRLELVEESVKWMEESLLGAPSDGILMLLGSLELK